MATMRIKIGWVLAVMAMMALRVTAQDTLVQDPGFEEEGRAQWLDNNFGPEFGIEWGATDQKHGGARALKLTATQKTDAPNKWEMSGSKQIFPIKPGDIISGGA